MQFHGDFNETKVMCIHFITLGGKLFNLQLLVLALYILQNITQHHMSLVTHENEHVCSY